MASVSNQLATVASSNNTTGVVGAPFKVGSSGVESLPKEMQDMKIKGDKKIDHIDDKVCISSFFLQTMVSAACLH